jgi:beta-lactamase regulating signal transducer with metallopeptidase domain
MWVWLDRAGSILFDATLSTAIFLTLVVLAMLVCRQPTRRLLIARSALVASLAMIPLVAFLPLPRFDLLDTLIQSDLLPKQLVAEIEQTGHPVSAPLSPEQASHWLRATDFHGRLLATSAWLPRGLILIDLTCVITGLAWLSLGIWGVRWLIRHSRTPSPATEYIYQQLCDSEMKRRSRPRLRVSSRVQHPVVVGLYRPTILLPLAFDEADGDPELLRLSLFHELAHAEQWDPSFGTIASLAQIVWFFLPQTWWVRSQLLIDQEFMADRFAASRYGTSSGYAASLVSLAESRPGPDAHDHAPNGPGNGLITAAKGDVRSPLAQRVLMLLHCPFRFEATAPRTWSWILRIMLTLGSIVAACLCIRWPDVGAIENRLKHGSVQASPEFRVGKFTVEPLALSRSGRALSFVMPVALPSHFELTVEVLAVVADLADLRIAGHPLGDPHIATALLDHSPVSPDMVKTWHSVRIKRQGDEVSLWIDGRSMPIRSSVQDTSKWLTIEPSPKHATEFRNLVVVW